MSQPIPQPSRAFRDDDLDAVVTLVNTGELGDVAEPEPRSRAAVRADLWSPQIDRARDLRLWADRDDAIRAGAWIRIAPSGGELHGRLHYVIARAVDGALEPEIVAWAARRLVDAGAGPRRLFHHVAGHDAARADRLASLGFVPHRLRYSMARPTTPALDAGALPPGYRIRPSRGAADAEAYAAAFNDTFVDTHDFTELTVAELVYDAGDPGYRPDLDLILDGPGGDIAGFCYVIVDEATPQLGYVASIGTRRGHRRHGLAGHLLAAALAALAAHGVTDVHLHVDADSPTGAPRLYQRHGFAVRYTEVRHALDDAGVTRLADRR